MATQKRAGALCNYNRYFFSFRFRLNNLFKILYVKGIGNGYVFHSETLTDFNKVCLLGRFAADSLARGGVILVPGHSGY